ncbi:MAG: hypothetical protein Q8M92_03710, partial [Candidatus Subteraquimicrobiales bacterium]|nr:hypothetical protein [Candidatus Subteraquimicrobiales bacterium]
DSTTSVMRAFWYGLIRQAFKCARETDYDLIIGLSPIGLIVATWLSRRFGIPCVYYNDEISFGDERNTLHGNAYGYAMKILERRANQRVLFTVTQDSERGRLLAKENCISMDSLRYLPNSRTGQAKISETVYIHRLFNFSPDTKIILWMGGVNPLAGALELAREAQYWPADYRMVFHFRTENPSSYIREIMKCHGKGQTYISNKPIPYMEVDDMVASATIGLGLYADTGINARYICSSSGKINSFLKMGVPCIVSDFQGLRWVEDAGAGICVNHPSDVFKAAEKIIENYENYQKRSVDIFESRLSFDKAFARIAGEIERQITEEMGTMPV